MLPPARAQAQLRLKNQTEEEEQEGELPLAAPRAELESEARGNRRRDPDIEQCLAGRNGRGTCPVEPRGKGRDASPIWLAFRAARRKTIASGEEELHREERKGEERAAKG
jgi:hypothetical protein